MRAAVWDRYGPPEVLRVTDVLRPVPAPDEVLIKVHATTVNRTDTGIRLGHSLISRLLSGFPRPRKDWRILGSEVAGEVVEAGAQVSEFKVGDEVFGVHAYRLGTHAEFVRMRESAPLVHKPAGASFAEAAAVCDGAILALMCLRPAGVRTGRSILVYGASGSIGTAAVQLSKYFEADVTAVCGTKNVELVRKVLFPIPPRYTKQDVLWLKELMEGGSYQAVIDRIYPLEQVLEATRYVETQQKTGNVVLTVTLAGGRAGRRYPGLAAEGHDRRAVRVPGAEQTRLDL